MGVHMIRMLSIAIFMFPLFLTADTIVVKTKAPQNRNAVFQYRVPRGYDKNRREMYRVLVIFGGRNTDGKADASGRMGWGKWCDDNGIFLVAPGLKNDNYWEPEVWSGKALRFNYSSSKEIYMIRLLQTIIFLLPLLLTAETITIKTKAPQNRNAVFQYLLITKEEFILFHTTLIVVLLL